MGSDFDDLAKAIASKSVPRRKVLKLMASALLASAGSSLLGTAASAQTTSTSDLPIGINQNTPDPCVNNPDLCVNNLQPCVNGVGLCVNTPDPCINHPELCVNNIDPCINHPELCVNNTQPCVNTTGQCDPALPCFNYDGLCVNTPTPPIDLCVNVADLCVNSVDPCFNHTGLCVNTPEPPVNTPPPHINLPGPFGGTKPVQSPLGFFDKNGPGINSDIFDIRSGWPSQQSGNNGSSLGLPFNLSRLKGRKF